MLFPQLRINLTDDVYARHVSIARKTGHLFSLSVINNTLQIVREKEITNDGKWGNGGPGIRKAFRFAPSRGTRIQKDFHSYSIICSIISSFYIVIDSARSSRVYYNFVLTSCKLKFLTYHLRQQFSRDLSGNDGNAIGSNDDRDRDRSNNFRVPFLDMFSRDFLRTEKLFQGHKIVVAFLVGMSLRNLRFVYSFLSSIPWRHPS